MIIVGCQQHGLFIKKRRDDRVYDRVGFPRSGRPLYIGHRIFYSIVDGQGEPVAPDEISAERNQATRHATIKKVTQDIYRQGFNTAVSALMEFVNTLYKQGAAREDLVVLGKLLKPFAPHLASEMLEKLEADDEWPTWDESLLVADTVEVVVQVNGKLRARLQVPADQVDDVEQLQSLALAEPNVQKYLTHAPKKIIVPPHAKLVNIVV